MGDFITNGELFHACYANRNMSKAEEIIMEYLSSKLVQDYTYETKLKRKVTTFCHSLRVKWQSSSRNKTTFEKKHHVWLQRKFDITMKSQLNAPEVINLNTNNGPGRPSKDFELSSIRSKQRKVKYLTDTVPPNELLFATKTKLNKTGKRAAADLLSLCTEHSPNRPVNIRNVYRESLTDAKKPVPMTPDEALALFINCDLSKTSYLSLRAESKKRNANIYPMYQKITEAKKKCYPDNVTVNDSGI